MTPVTLDRLAWDAGIACMNREMQRAKDELNEARAAALREISP